MRILYDGFIYSEQVTGGISRYFASLIARLPEDCQPMMTCGARKGVLWPRHPRLRAIGLPLNSILPRRISNKLSRPYFRAARSMLRPDVFHPTFHYLLPNDEVRQNRRPTIVTIHDTIPEIFASDLDADGSDVRAKKKAIEIATAIICVSENTKRDLQERYRVPDSRVTVTYLASDITREMSFGDEAVPCAPYVLFVGNRGIYKNFVRTLLAFSRMADSWRELVLCVIGYPFNSTELELIRNFRLAARVDHRGFVSDTHLAKLYRCSQALVYPSLYEGFGIPPLEAMACGTVVITSNRSSLPEVVGDVALLINPESVEQLSEAILSLRDPSIGRETLIERGFVRARQFSWEETARRTMEVYRSVAN